MCKCQAFLASDVAFSYYLLELRCAKFCSLRRSTDRNVLPPLNEVTAVLMLKNFF